MWRPYAATSGVRLYMPTKRSELGLCVFSRIVLIGCGLNSGVLYCCSGNIRANGCYRDFLYQWGQIAVLLLGVCP